MARVLVTGASGFIGGALLDRLLAGGDQVVALARSDAAAQQLRARGADVARGDVLDESTVRAAATGCEIAYNVAGVNTLCPDDPDHLLRVNIEGAAAVVRAAAAAGVRRIVHTSSSAAIGEGKGVIATEATPHRGSYLSVYERSKHLAEEAVRTAVAGSGAELVLVNPASVQGPGRVGGTGKLLLAFLNGKLRLFVDTTISIVDIRDCVEAHVLAAERGTPGERYLVSGAALPVSEAFDIAAEIAGVSSRPRYVPAAPAHVLAAVVETGFRAVRRTPPVCREMVRTMLHGHHYDGSRATRELGLVYSPVQDTLGRTLEWARAEGLVRPPDRVG